ncbi:elongator complex protein 4 [Pantherophis guttatus]|uniref:Elongator complex protein 4 n=1 Tax=Pantherophis guttatus TaxID=94885 RepID=A0A6P9BP49_PANGU|nr:elongator complex protein 4 [Pantherophis guttatus]
MAGLATEGLARRESATTSFQRKVPDGGGGRLAVLPGTRPSVRHGQLLVSSGVPSLDSFLGGGLAIGTLLLVEEDVYGVYSNLLFKNFLAEGVVCGHNLFIASDKEEPGIILKVTHIPFSKFGHYFDLTKTIAPELIQNIKWDGFFIPEEGGLDIDEKSCKKACAYTRLLHSIQRVICQQGYTFQKKQRNVLRIGIQSLGSVLWGDDICCTENPENLHSLTRFMYALRGLLRTSLSVCIITVPTHLIQNKAIMERVTHLSDTVIGLESFIGSERETNPLYKDYHGLVHIHQIPRLNSLICDVSNTKDLAFKLKRKLFVIERLHLPPDLSDTVSRTSKQDLAVSAKLLSTECSAMAMGKKHLDF